MPDISSNERFIIISCAIIVVFAWLLQPALFAAVIAQGTEGLDIANIYKMTCWILTLIASLFIPAILVVAAGNCLEKYISSYCFFVKYLQPSLIAIPFCMFAPIELRIIISPIFLSGYLVVFASPYVIKWCKPKSKTQ